MKKLATICLWFLPLLGASLGQGTVNFVNDTASLSLPPDRLVRFCFPGECNPFGMAHPAVGTNLQVQLYYGASTSFDTALQPVAQAPARLRASTTSVPGTWEGGGMRTLSGFEPGTYVLLQVRVWDIQDGLTYEQWVTNQYPAGCGSGGRSHSFLYLIPTNGSAASNFVMDGFQAFCIGALPALPGIEKQPTNQIVVAGQDTLLAVGVSGSRPITNAWWFNGTNLLSANTNLLTITNVQPHNAGTYQLIASNLWGVKTSSVATITVVVPRLSIRPANPEQAQIVWSTNLSTFGLEYASSIQGSTWQSVTSTPIIQGSNHLVVEPTLSQRFYRLRKQ
jgi:hypothetical protein